MIDPQFPILSKYLLGHTYEEIGKELGITRERVRQKLEKEKATFFRKNVYLKQRIRNLIYRNGYFYTFRKKNRLFRLTKVLAKEENFKFSTLSVRENQVFLVMSSGYRRENLMEVLSKIKEDFSLPAEISKVYKQFMDKGFPPVLISLFLKLYSAVLKNGEIVRFNGLSTKENIKMYVKSGAKLQVDEISEVLSASRATVRKTLRELGVLKIKRREKGFNRNKLLAVNLTEDEYRKIKRISEELGYSISTLVRKELKKAGLI